MDPVQQVVRIAIGILLHAHSEVDSFVEREDMRGVPPPDHLRPDRIEQCVITSADIHLIVDDRLSLRRRQTEFRRKDAGTDRLRQIDISQDVLLLPFADRMFIRAVPGSAVDPVKDSGEATEVEAVPEGAEVIVAVQLHRHATLRRDLADIITQNFYEIRRDSFNEKPFFNLTALRPIPENLFPGGVPAPPGVIDLFECPELVFQMGQKPLIHRRGAFLIFRLVEEFIAENPAAVTAENLGTVAVRLAVLLPPLRLNQ